MRNGDGMFRKITVIILILSICFISFADDLKDDSGVEIFKKKEEAPVETKKVEEGVHRLGLESVLSQALGFTSLATAHIICYSMYRKDWNLDKLAGNMLGSVFLVYLAGTGVIALKEYIDVSRYNKSKSDAVKNGILLSTKFYSGGLAVLLIEACIAALYVAYIIIIICIFIYYS